MRGRPSYSSIRQNIVEILNVMGKGYGYEVYQAYREIFPEATIRSIYTQLKRGVVLGEFEIEAVKTEKGDYSWGPEAEKVYYRLGGKASPKGDVRVGRYLEGMRGDMDGNRRKEKESLKLS